MITDNVSIERIVFPVLLLAGLTSCGGSEAPKAETAPQETATEPAAGLSASCAFLTADDIQAALGKAPGAPQTPVGTQDCIWPASEDPSTTLVRVTFSDSGYASYEAFVSSYQAEFGGEQPPTEYYRPIEGVGDWAMWVADEHALQVFQGGRMLQVATSPPDEQQSLALAQKALPRLP